MIFGFTPPGSEPLGGVKLANPVTVSNLVYEVGGLGWAVLGGLVDLPAGTFVDTCMPRWTWLVGVGPPPDAVPLNQYTYDFMTNSNGVIGAGYPFWAVGGGGGVVPIWQ
jgi:hypothetical protein